MTTPELILYGLAALAVLVMLGRLAFWLIVVLSGGKWRAKD
jgi:hypothetical protein